MDAYTETNMSQIKGDIEPFSRLAEEEISDRVKFDSE